MKKRFFVALILVAVVAAALSFIVPAAPNIGLGSVWDKAISFVRGGSEEKSDTKKTESAEKTSSSETKKEATDNKTGNANNPAIGDLSNQKHAHQNPTADEKLFILAVKNNDIGTATQMLKKGVDVDGVWPGIGSYSSSATVFSIALQGKNMDMMQFLRKNGADVSGYYDYNNNRVCYLECATRNSYNADATIIQFLLNEGADVNGTTSRNDGVKVAAIDNCAKTGSERSIPVTQLLIEKGAYLENKDAEGFTPFLKSIDRKNIVLARVFADGGADLSAKDKKGRDGLQIAIDNNNLQLYKDVQEIMNQGQKPSKYRPSKS